MVDPNKSEATDPEVSEETLKSIEKEIMDKDKAEKATEKTERTTRPKPSPCLPPLNLAEEGPECNMWRKSRSNPARLFSISFIP